jgi:putative transposase
MKTHVHLILVPKPDSNGELNSLSQIMHSIKSYSAKKINQVTQHKGRVWLEESYDRIIRDDDEYNEKMNYIIYNPVKADLVKSPLEYKWLFVKECNNIV